MFSDEKIPSSGTSYMKLEDGDNRIRILCKPVAGYSAWSQKKKIHKKTENEFDGIDIDQSKFGSAIKYFWAFTVWNYAEERVQLLELTQKQIMYGIEQLSENEKWGKDVLKHDINILRGEQGGKVAYSVLAEPGDLSEEAKEKIKTVQYDLSRLFTGENVFKQSDSSGEVSIESIPF